MESFKATLSNNNIKVGRDTVDTLQVNMGKVLRENDAFYQQHATQKARRAKAFLL